MCFFFFSSRRRHTRSDRDWSSDVCSSDLVAACELAAIAKRDGLTRARLVNVITDHEAEPVWVRPEADAYAVADEAVREQLCAWGARAETVTVCGIPTAQSFAARHDRRATRERLGINDDAPIALL